MLFCDNPLTALLAIDVSPIKVNDLLKTSELKFSLLS